MFITASVGSREEDLSEAGFAGSWDTMKEVTPAGRYTTICVPLEKIVRLVTGRKAGTTYFLTLQEISGFNTMLAIGRLCLESVQCHEP
jgi:hypothetical protein